MIIDFNQVNWWNVLIGEAIIVSVMLTFFLYILSKKKAHR